MVSYADCLVSDLLKGEGRLQAGNGFFFRCNIR